MTKTTLTFEELDAIVDLIEYLTPHEDWDEMSEVTALDADECEELHKKLYRMRNEV